MWLPGSGRCSAHLGHVLQERLNHGAREGLVLQQAGLDLDLLVPHAWPHGGQTGSAGADTTTNTSPSD